MNVKWIHCYAKINDYNFNPFNYSNFENRSYEKEIGIQNYSNDVMLRGYPINFTANSSRQIIRTFHNTDQ